MKDGKFETIEELLQHNKTAVASYDDPDLMHIKAFATHEGINVNGTNFPRGILMSSYRSFIHKPVVIVPDKNNSPTGHAFDFKKGVFDKDKRNFIGHIVYAEPIFVDEKDNFYYEEEYAPEDAQLRILVEIAIYRNYVKDIASKLEFLHSIDDLFFSMEAIVDGEKNDEGIYQCSFIHFTGLAVVANPAFINSYSLEVAEQEEKMEELQAKYDALIAEKAVVDSEKKQLESKVQELETELAETKTSLAEAIAEKETAVAELTPLKEKVEEEAKIKLAEERKEKLSKFREVSETDDELSGLTDIEFANVLVEAAMNVSENVQTSAVYTKNITAKNNKDILKGYLL